MNLKTCPTCGQEIPSNITPRPDCPTCGRETAQMAAIQGKKRYMCTNPECKDQFKQVIYADSAETTSASSTEGNS